MPRGEEVPRCQERPAPEGSVGRLWRDYVQKCEDGMGDTRGLVAVRCAVGYAAVDERDFKE